MIALYRCMESLRRSIRNKSYRYPYCLCIIDVQSGFNTAHKVVKECTEWIKHAINDGAFIILTQYTGFQKTYHEITKILYNSSYREYSFCWANKNSKSHVVTNVMFNNNVHTDKIVICGINTSACVHMTVNDLSHSHPEKTLYVIENACADVSEFWHQTGLQLMSKFSNVQLRP